MWQRKKGVESFFLLCILNFLQDGVDIGLSTGTLKMLIAALLVFSDLRLA